MMYHHKFKIGAHVALSPPRGQIVGFSVRPHPHTGVMVTYYDVLTPHGEISNVPEESLHFYEPGMKYAPDPLANDPLAPKPVPARGDVEYAEELTKGSEEGGPLTKDDILRRDGDKELLDALGVEKAEDGTFRASTAVEADVGFREGYDKYRNIGEPESRMAMAPVPGDGDSYGDHGSVERRRADVGYNGIAPMTGRRAADSYPF